MKSKGSLLFSSEDNNSGGEGHYKWGRRDSGHNVMGRYMRGLGEDEERPKSFDPSKKKEVVSGPQKEVWFEDKESAAPGVPVCLSFQSLVLEKHLSYK